ncbi:glycosyltransferase family 2 protein [Pseudomonas sp. ZM23]|uniref:Glycosyltransferase family A protein n=1 Tax=Pseudomonas triclosanedens TaxID=2961893 RepID=A0ABY6ZXL1_9PSED|nr:glycosyltransferase family A protein [Pseudomonas triclosanedens]MCP8462388.1 glycosyltransferase family 2 protein [Pseudomonas triclosanedens]MCP8468026.1 glycosyltransferase family 2 protein [Pseudomonas triclosanedens]MCP8474785.1 glycosyltransferase family 2 protein [Pseudomonas triclosanedens]WAI49581.1 glycosyltransferase family A protein [Pseudomonas triclosanedens]
MTAPSPQKPLLSIIVIAYDMPRQALNTLISLAPDYQEGVSADDYEVILVENRSRRNMDAEAISRLPGNFRYFLRDEPGVSPAPAINFAIGQARGRFIGLMIDGARMVTPGVVRYALMALRMDPGALVAVPGYHLGEDEQQYHLARGYSEEKEQALLAGIDWRNNGYRLFEISCWSGANPKGFFQPFMECNCLFMAAELLAEIGNADERFDMPGGGALNLYIYGALAWHPRTQLYVLAGEGSFHQLHGGVTTSQVEGRAKILEQQKAQLHELLGRRYRSPTVEPILLGKIKAPAQRYLLRSAELAQERFDRFAYNGEHPFQDDLRKLEREPH